MNGAIIPVKIDGEWTVVTSGTIANATLAYWTDGQMISVYIDYRVADTNWTQIGTLPAEVRPFYTEYVQAYTDLTINGYKVYHIDKDTGAVSAKGNLGQAPIIHTYPHK